MKFKVTEKGVHTQSGEKVPVGTVLELPGGKVPGYLVGKGAAIDEDHERVIAESDEDEDAADEDAAEKKPRRRRSSGA